ncbi:MAG: SMC family ATPase [Anaerolineae bacterium]|nr:SMC family ATPase [Anaerolineae bacterium]
MRPIELVIENFLAYRDQVRLSFEGIHVACLTGANGAGKSSLLDAITWALWGKARTSDRDQLMHSGQRQMSVALTFEQDGRYYQVRRSYAKSGRSSKQEVWLRFYDPESAQWIPISEQAATREIDHEIVRRIGLDYETFVYSAFLQQGKADAFATQIPSKRKEILADILGLALWETYEDRAKQKASECASQRKHSAYEVERLEAELAQETALHQKVEQLAAQLKIKQAELNRAEEAYRAVMSAPDQLAAAQREHKALTQSIATLKSDLSQLARDIAELKQEIAQYDALVAQRAEIERAESQRQQLEAALVDFDRRGREFERLEREYRKAEAALGKARERLEAQCEALAKQIAQLEQDAAQRDNLQKQRDEAQAELDALEQRKSELQNLRNQIVSLQAARAKRKTENEQIEREGKQLRNRLEALQGDEAALCPVCNQPLSVERRTALIAEYTDQIEALRERYRQNDQALKAEERQVEQLERRARDLEATLKRHESDLNKRLGTLNERLKATNSAAERAAQLRAERAALQAQLDSGSFAQDARQVMAACERDAEALQYDPEAHDALRQELATLQDARLHADRLRQALEKLPVLRQRVAEKQKQAEQKKAYLTDLEAHLPELEASLSELVERARQAELCRAERDQLRTAYHTLTEEFAYYRSQLANLASLRERCEMLRREVADLKEQEQLYSELQYAFSKRGVPAMLIEAAIPELELMANELLARMTDGRMHLRFETQRSKKGGDGTIETLEILISDELGQRDYALYSGGESFRVNFALRVALSQFLARRAGTQLRTLIIDEGFGSQDAVGRERLIEAINAVQDRFDLILVVTHIEELRDAFPTHIEVRKSPNGGATLTVRQCAL